jgi:hypothetical protein
MGRDGRTDRETDMSKPIVTVRSCLKAPKMAKKPCVQHEGVGCSGAKPHSLLTLAPYEDNE